jgi:nitrogen fixation protein NifU and related proteins
VHLTLRDGVVVDAGFEGEGCAISTASASLMTEAIKGRTVAEIETLFTGVHDLVAGNADPLDAQERVGKLAVLAGVREYPMRVKCATLPWHTLHAALRGEEHPVSTE